MFRPDETSAPSMSKRSCSKGAAVRNLSNLCTKFPGTIAAADRFLFGVLHPGVKITEQWANCVHRAEENWAHPLGPSPRGTKAPPAAEPTGSVDKPSCHSFGPGSGGTFLAPETFCAAQHRLELRFLRPHGISLLSQFLNLLPG